MQSAAELKFTPSVLKWRVETIISRVNFSKQSMLRKLPRLRIICQLQDRRLVVLVVSIGHRSTIYEE
jgi:mRNA-degrading endonuclease RelE of RelBE toxin-antitoxin system